MGSDDTGRALREERVFAGRRIPVVVVPRIMRRHGAIPYAVGSLWKGMKLTLGYLVHPSRIVTKQYPENRATLKFPPRFRAILRLIYEENGYHRCTGCRLCEKACPNASIRVITRRNPVTNRPEVDRHLWRQDSCMVCNACVQSCPFDALEMGHEFESAVYDRRLLIYGLNRYAGPPASVMLKQEDPAVRAQMMAPRGRYDGPVPMAGVAWPRVRPLGPPPPEAAPSPAPPKAAAPATEIGPS